MVVADAGLEDGFHILEQFNGSMTVISPYQYCQCGTAVVVGCLPGSDLMLDGVPFLEVQPGVRAVAPGIQRQIVQVVKGICLKSGGDFLSKPAVVYRVKVIGMGDVE